MGKVLSCVSHALYPEVAQLSATPATLPHVPSRVAIQRVEVQLQWSSMNEVTHQRTYTESILKLEPLLIAVSKICT